MDPSFFGASRNIRSIIGMGKAWIWVGLLMDIGG
jgi:hypothetical protein